MGKCIVRKVISPQEIKIKKKQKAVERWLNIGLMIFCFVLLVTLALCLVNQGVLKGLERQGIVIPNFCLPWWGMAGVLCVLYFYIFKLSLSMVGSNIIKYIMLGLFVCSTVLFYFRFFYLSLIFLTGGVAMAGVCFKNEKFKTKVKFLPFFVLLCYVLLMVYFFALIN